MLYQQQLEIPLTVLWTMLDFLIKIAITVVTPPVVFHTFPLPVTHVFFFAVRQNHSGVTADMAIPLSYNCGLMAVPRR